MNRGRQIRFGIRMNSANRCGLRATDHGDPGWLCMLTRWIQDNGELTAAHRMDRREHTIASVKTNAKQPRSATSRPFAADQGVVEIETDGTKGPTKGMACNAMVAADKPILARFNPEVRTELTFAGYPDA